MADTPTWWRHSLSTDTIAGWAKGINYWHLFETKGWQSLVKVPVCQNAFIVMSDLYPSPVRKGRYIPRLCVQCSKWKRAQEELQNKGRFY